MVLLAALALAGWQPHAKAQSTIDLGSAAGFAVLASSGITFSAGGTTTIAGDIGTAPTASTGLENLALNGTNQANDATTQNAQVNLATAYSSITAQTGGFTVGTELGGTTLTPGIYTAATFGITGTLTLNAQGNPNAVWIFQDGFTLTTAALSQVALINGAQAANVFWQVGSSATLSGTDFSGSILAHDSITLTSGAMVDGRLLALGAHVTLDGNTITVPSAIPEPATNALITALGALGLAVWRRRRTAG